MKKRPIPEVLTTEEQTQILALMPNGTLLQRRNLAMVRLMLFQGLRSHEVCELRTTDLSFPSGKLKVRGKGGRQRIVWLRPNDQANLRNYLVEAAPVGYLFQTGHGQKVDTRFLRTMLMRYGLQAKIRLHPHLLRHTFATDLLRETKNLRLVQKALGHAHIGTTEIYTHIVDEELEDAMKNFKANMP
jgi:site-specific recombinase XerD